MTASRSASSSRTSASSCTAPAAMAAPSSSTRRLASPSSPTSAARTLFELGAGLFQARRPRSPGRRLARRARRAPRRLPPRGCSGPRRPRALRTAGAAPRSAARRPAAARPPAVRSTRAPLPAGDRACLAPLPPGALARQLLGLLREARLLIGRVLQLRVESDNGLVLLVMLGVQRGDRVGGMSDGRLELRRLPARAASAPGDRRRCVRAAP